MNNALTLVILTPERKSSIEGVLALTVQLVDGSLGILPGHAPLLAETSAAPLLYRSIAGGEEQLSLGSGILWVDHDKVTIFIAGEGMATGQTPVRLLQRGLAKWVGVDRAHGKEG